MHDILVRLHTAKALRACLEKRFGRALTIWNFEITDRIRLAAIFPFWAGRHRMKFGFDSLWSVDPYPTVIGGVRFLRFRLDDLVGPVREAPDESIRDISMWRDDWYRVPNTRDYWYENFAVIPNAPWRPDDRSPALLVDPAPLAPGSDPRVCRVAGEWRMKSRVSRRDDGTAEHCLLEEARLEGDLRLSYSIRPVEQPAEPVDPVPASPRRAAPKPASSKRYARGGAAA